MEDKRRSVRSKNYLKDLIDVHKKQGDPTQNLRDASGLSVDPSTVQHQRSFPCRVAVKK